MSGVKRTSERLKNKLDLKKSAPPVKTESDPCASIKTTLYLTADTAEKFKELCKLEMDRHGKPNKTVLINQAINLLYDKIIGS